VRQFIEKILKPHNLPISTTMIPARRHLLGTIMSAALIVALSWSLVGCCWCCQAFLFSPPNLNLQRHRSFASDLYSPQNVFTKTDFSTASERTRPEHQRWRLRDAITTELTSDVQSLFDSYRTGNVVTRENFERIPYVAELLVGTAVQSRMTAAPRFTVVSMKI
jgi:hypothetical protein